MVLDSNVKIVLSAPLTDILPSPAISMDSLKKNGVLTHMTTWDVENETYAEFKKRRSAESGISGMGQKKREGTGKINKSDLRAEALKRANYTL